jgi:hypothetical protein
MSMGFNYSDENSYLGHMLLTLCILFASWFCLFNNEFTGERHNYNTLVIEQTTKPTFMTV